MSKYMTKQRKTLLSYLSLHPDELLSAQEIGEALKDDKISVSSVYRNLSELEAEGSVRRSSKSNAREIYFQYIGAESCKDCLHLQCTKCGRTFHMGNNCADRLADVLASLEGFKLDRSETVLHGICKGCRQ